MNTSEESTEEEEKGGDDIQDTDFISLSHFELLDESSREFILPYCYFSLLYDAGVALDLAWEGDLLDMDSQDKLQPV